MPETNQVPRHSGRPALWLLRIIAGGLLAVAIVGMAVWFATGVGFLHLLPTVGAGRTIIEVGQPAVVRQVQQLQRLEAVSYTVEKIISGERDTPYLPKFLVSDRLLLVVHGEVIGGVDLSKLQPADVVVQGRRVSIRLPHSEVFSTRIDNAKTRVYSRDTGLFSSPDPNLETAVRQEAERQIQFAALQDGILKAADQNARMTVSAMLKGLGFEQVDIQQ